MKINVTIMKWTFLIAGMVVFLITYAGNYSSDTSIFWVMNLGWFILLGLGLSLGNKEE